MKPAFLVPLLSAALLSGCTSAVVPAGPDTYYISKGPLPFWMAAARAKADCYRSADAWCQKRGLIMVPVNSEGREPIIGRGGSAELTFRAVKPSQP